jgi:hypothetical protein
LPGGKGAPFALEPRGRTGWTATPAPAIAAPRPVLTTLTANGAVEIGLKSDLSARVFRLAIKPSRDLVGATLNGLPVVIKRGAWLSILHGGATPPDLHLRFPAGQGGKVELSILSATAAPVAVIPLAPGRVASNWAPLSDTLVSLNRSSFSW